MISKTTQVPGGYTWTLNGTPLPRNPDSAEWPMTKGNAGYETMLDGSYRRITLPRKFAGRQVKLGWKATDARARSVLAKVISSNAKNTLVFGGTLPLLQLNFYVDDQTKDNVSDQIFDPKAGQGGIRRDIQIEGIGEPYFRSVNVVPSNLPTQAQVNGWFAGPTGDYAIDGLIAWNGNKWNNTLNAASQAFAMTNMGSAPWSPVIRINGPFNSGLQIGVTYADIDGTGQGVLFTWIGGAVTAGNYVLFDTYSGRVYSVASGISTEVYSYTITTKSNSTPWSYWPEAPALSNFTVTTYNVAGYGAGTSLDYSNNGTEQFRYA